MANTKPRVGSQGNDEKLWLPLPKVPVDGLTNGRPDTCTATASPTETPAGQPAGQRRPRTDTDTNADQDRADRADRALPWLLLDRPSQEEARRSDKETWKKQQK